MSDTVPSAATSISERQYDGLPKRSPQDLHQLKRHTGTGKLARGALVLELGIGQGHALRHLVGRLVMVRDHQIDPQTLQIGDLFLGSNTVIDGHNHVGLSELG